MEQLSQEQLEELRKKRAQEEREAEALTADPGTENICIGCE